MSEICTFVFFDIETTGLITCIQPKITELAFTACTREHLLNSNKNEIPRVLHKLLLPFNPQKVIQPESTRITGKIFTNYYYNFYHTKLSLIDWTISGLDNFLLEYLGKMDGNTTDLINCFFSQLRKPVCLVAHNGNKFDYLILAEHLKKLVSPTVLLPSFAELKNQTNFYF